MKHEQDVLGGWLSGLVVDAISICLPKLGIYWFWSSGEPCSSFPLVPWFWPIIIIIIFVCVCDYIYTFGEGLS